MRFASAVVLITGITAIGAFRATLGAQERVSAEHTRTAWDGIYTAEQADRGEPLYLRECAVCHGPDLMGAEEAPALTGGEFIWKWSGLSMGDLFERLRVSMPQGDPRRVSRQQKADILAFLLRKNDFPVGATELSTRTEMLNQITFLAVKP